MASSKKRKKSDSSNTVDQRGSSSGIHCGIRGNEYQIFMTMYILLRAHNKYPLFDYQLMMERSESDAGKFDDIWLKVGYEQMFVQAKHNTVRNNLTKSMVLLEGDRDPFSLLKYNNSHKKCILPLYQSELKKCWCVLMTNLPLNKDLEEHFEEYNQKHMPSYVIGVGKLFKFKSKKIGNFEATDEFCRDFVLSVGKGVDNGTSNDKGKTRLCELQRKIEDEIERLMFEDGEYAFHRLRVKLVKWVCNKEYRQKKEYINRKWVKDFFINIKSDYKLIVNAYVHEFRDRLELYQHIQLQDESVYKLKDYLKLRDKTNIILPFKETPIMRLKQIFQGATKKKLTFVPYSRMQSDTIKAKVKSALKSEKELKYVLILLNDRKEAVKIFELAQELINDCENIIILSEKVDELKNEYVAKNMLFHLDSSDITMANFTRKTRENLAKELVSFQGFIIAIEQLPNLVGFQSNITGARLQTLIDRYPINIGISLPSVDTRCSHYLQRRLTMSKLFFKTKQMENDSNIRFVENFRGIDASRIIHYIILISDEEQLKSIAEPINKPVYCSVFMKLSPDYCYLKKSFGKEKHFGNEVLKYKADWCARKSGVPEDDYHNLIKDCPGQVIILAGDIGTGKSTTLLKLANIQKKKNPSTWVVFVDLNTETTNNKQFECDASITKEFVVELLSALIAVEEDRKYFEDCLEKDSQNVVIYLDGFDEACPTYKAGVLQFIEILVKLRVQRVFVSTRTQYEKELETRFSAASYRLKSLTDEECVEMIQSLWKIQDRPDEQAEAIVKEMGLKLKAIMQGVPLVLHMLAKISPQDVDRFLSDNFTLYDLFEVFMGSILTRYFTEKSKMNMEQNYIRSRDIPKLQQSYSRDFTLIAIKWLFPDDYVQRFFAKNDRDDWEELSRESIGDLTCSEMIIGARFVHRSYAEYYAAVFIYTKFIRAENMSAFWDEFSPVLVTKGLVSSFFYQKLNSRNNNDIILKIKQFFTIITSVPLRYECSRDYSTFLKFLLQNEMLNYVINTLISIWFKFEPHTAIQAAVQFKQISIVKDNLKEQSLIIGNLNASGQTLLHVAAQAGSVEIAQELIKCKLEPSKLDCNGCNMSMVAYRSKQFEMTAYILNDFSAVSFESYKRTEARNMLLLVLLNLSNLPNASIQVLEKNDYGILVKLINDFILITTDYEELTNYIKSIKETYAYFDEVSDQQETENIIRFLRSTYPEPEPRKLTVTEEAYRWEDIDIYNDMVFDFNKRLKIFTVGYTQVEFNSQVYKHLSLKTLFRDPLYALSRLQYKFGDFFEGTKVYGLAAETVISQLNQEALKHHSEEASIKYNKFEFKEPIPVLTDLNLFLQSEKTGLHVVHDTIESARICKYLGDRIHAHVPGWMLRHEQMSSTIEEILNRPEMQLVKIHNLDCDSKDSTECENCKLILEKGQNISQNLKVVVSLKHPLQTLNESFLANLTDESVNMIKNNVVSFGSNYLRFHELHDITGHHCIKNGALEYIALNEPICLGQKHPFYFIPWMHRIARVNETLPLMDTFYGSLDKLLEQKFSIISKSNPLVIPTCQKCAGETDLFPLPIFMLACEASWRQKTTLVLHTDVITLSEFSNSSGLIELLVKWYRSEEDDPLNCSCVELYLQQSPNDVVLMIDASEADLEENHVELLTKFYSESTIRSVLVYVESNDKMDQLERATSTGSSFILYRLKEDDDKSPSMPKLFPAEARVCEHFRQHPFEISEHFV